MIDVGELTVNDAATFRSVTEVIPAKFVPVIVTELPTAPLPGVKPEIVGVEMPPVTVKDVVLVPVPLGASPRSAPSSRCRGPSP